MARPFLASTLRPSKSSTCTWRAAVMSRSGEMADDVVAQPVLPRKDRRILHIDVDIDIDADVANPAPGNPVWFARLRSAEPPPYTDHHTFGRPAKTTRKRD